MAWKRSKPEGEFDAVHAAEELDEAMVPEAPVNTDEYIRTLELEIEGINNLLIQKEMLLERATARADESLEEIERVKKRLEVDAAQQVEKKVAKVINELLDVGDDLGRAILAAQDMDHNPDVVKGIELVRQSFGKRLEKLGVTRIIALGNAFDPQWHDAVSAMPVDDPAQDGIVLNVVQEGFVLNDKVLREARVVVGKLSS
jgi:molecular chaperone GrpE